MLILSDTNGFWINLDQFSQWILQSSCNGCRTSLTDIKIRKFFRCQFAGGINTGTCFINDHIGHLLRYFFQKLNNHLLGFSGSSSISKGNQSNPVLLNQLFQNFFGLINFFLRFCRIDHNCVQDLSRWIHNSQFTACSKCRIPSKNRLSFDRRLHQKLMQILSENSHSPLFSLFCQCISYFALHSRRDQSAITVLRCCFQHRCCIWIFLMDDLPFQPSDQRCLWCFNSYVDNLFFFRSVDSQNSVSRNF